MPPLKGEVPAARAEGFNHADFGRSDVWRPIVVDRTGGSNRLSAQPTGSQWNRALPTEAESPS